MHISILLPTCPFLLLLASSSSITASILPAKVSPRQSPSWGPVINTTELYLGACLSIGSCYWETNQLGCYTAACGNETDLGSICSCNSGVQAALDVQLAKGLAEWPIKCPY